MNTRDDVRKIVENAILNQPRTLQQTIGPSEIGTDCDRCLGHKLAGTPKRQEVAWLPYVGTAMHSQLERVLEAAGNRWSTEVRLLVGQIDGHDILGSCDLFDAETGTTVDYKLVGKTTLTSARIGPSQQYRIQAHLYGRGWANDEYDVNTVAIWYLPRNAVSLEQSIWWQEPYDEQIALDALARADALAQAIRILGSEQVLPGLERKDGCYDCGRYPAFPGDPVKVDGAFSDLAPTLEGVPA